MNNRTRAFVVSVGLAAFAALLPTAHALAGNKWA